jgi:hypothetical protein
MQFLHIHPPSFSVPPSQWMSPKSLPKQLRQTLPGKLFRANGTLLACTPIWTAALSQVRWEGLNSQSALKRCNTPSQRRLLLLLPSRIQFGAQAKWSCSLAHFSRWCEKCLLVEVWLYWAPFPHKGRDRGQWERWEVKNVVLLVRNLIEARIVLSLNHCPYTVLMTRQVCK